MGIYDERNNFINREQKEDSINDANLEMTENFPPDANDISDIGRNNNIFDLNPRGELTSSFCEREIFENRELIGFFQDIEPENFSNIFVEKNLELSNDDHISLFSVKQNFKCDSKEVISDNAFSEILNKIKLFIKQW